MVESFIKLSEHCYCYESKSAKRSLLGVVIGDDQVLFVNGGISPMQMGQMLDFFRGLDYHTDLPPLGVITDHGLKHVLGMQACGKMPFISHSITKQKLDEMKNWKFTDKFLEKKVNNQEILASDLKALKKEWPEERQVEIMIPCIIYRHKLELDLGHISCKLEHIESDHAEDTTIVFIEEDGVMFIGDILEPGYQGHSSYYTKKLMSVMDILMSYKAKYYVTSKGSKIYNQNDFFEYCEYLRIVGATVAEHYENFQAIEEALGGDLDKDDHTLIGAFINGIAVEKNKE